MTLLRRTIPIIALVVVGYWVPMTTTVLLDKNAHNLPPSCVQLAQNTILNETGGCCLPDRMDNEVCVAVGSTDVKSCSIGLAQTISRPGAPPIIEKSLIHKTKKGWICYNPLFDFDNGSSVTFGIHIKIYVFYVGWWDSFDMIEQLCVYPNGVGSNDELEGIYCCQSMSDYIFKDYVHLTILVASQPYDPSAKWAELSELLVSKISEIDLSKARKGYLNQTTLQIHKFPPRKSFFETYKKAIIAIGVGFLMAVTVVVLILATLVSLFYKRQNNFRINTSVTSAVIQATSTM